MNSDQRGRTRSPATAGEWAQVAALCAALLWGALTGSPAAAQGDVTLRGEGRVALVIGNADYARAPLRNPVNDAKAVAAALRGLGFDVLYYENAALEDMIDAMREFVLRGRDSNVRVVYYAGHGSQVKDKNYLIPVDATLKDEEELPRKTANASAFVDKLGTLESGVNIVILDACRDKFPVGTRTRGVFGSTRSLASGLAPVMAPKGTLVAFSTAPGKMALDGTEGNSPYAKHLVANIPIPGLPVEQMFKRVRVAVSEETRQAQIPWESSSLMGDFCFTPSAGGECAPATATAAAPARQ